MERLEPGAHRNVGNQLRDEHNIQLAACVGRLCPAVTGTLCRRAGPLTAGGDGLSLSNTAAFGNTSPAVVAMTLLLQQRTLTLEARQHLPSALACCDASSTGAGMKGRSFGGKPSARTKPLTWQTNPGHPSLRWPCRHPPRHLPHAKGKFRSIWTITSMTRLAEQHREL